MNKNLKIEYRRFLLDDFSNSPKCFETDFPDQKVRLIRHDNCGMILQKDNSPHYYFHNLDEYKSRWSGIIQLGNGPFSLQSKLSGLKMNQNGDLENTYDIVSDSPKTYGVKSKNGIPFEFTYNEIGCHLVEGFNGGILDVEGEWFPIGLICHMGSEYNIPFMHIPVHLKGLYKGKSIEMLACIDRIFAPQGCENQIMKNATSYVSSYCPGIREDGRKELLIALQCHDNGHGLGLYWIEGDKPIISDEVYNEGIWEELPYVKDGTVVCKDIVWKFAGKEFHVKGLWGSKGFTEEPKLDRHGQSQMFGTWHVGKKEYKHIIWNTFNENMEVYKDSMKSRGFFIK